jgi:hypothetical protein
VFYQYQPVFFGAFSGMKNLGGEPLFGEIFQAVTFRHEAWARPRGANLTTAPEDDTAARLHSRAFRIRDNSRKMRSIMETKRLGELSRGAMLKASTWLRQEKGSLNVLYALALIPMIERLATDTAMVASWRAFAVIIRRSSLAARFFADRDADVLNTANFRIRPDLRCAVQADFMDAAVTSIAGRGRGAGMNAFSAAATIPATFMRV